MRAPAHLVREAYERASGTTASHILMIWAAAESPPDDWSAETVHTPEELQEQLARPGGFFQLREVYTTRRPIEEQLTGTAAAWFVE